MRVFVAKSNTFMLYGHTFCVVLPMPMVPASRTHKRPHLSALIRYTVFNPFAQSPTAFDRQSNITRIQSKMCIFSVNSKWVFEWFLPGYGINCGEPDIVCAISIYVSVAGIPTQNYGETISQKQLKCVLQIHEIIMNTTRNWSSVENVVSQNMHLHR